MTNWTELIRDRPDRFAGFACLPLPDVDGALAELAYAFDDLRLDGVVLFSNARGIYLILGATATKLIPRLASLQSKSQTRASFSRPA